MGSVFTIGKALIKRNLRMTILVGIIFVLCIGGMIGALSIQMSTIDAFDKIADQNKAPHLIKIYSGQILDIVKIDEFLKKNALVDSYSLRRTGDSIGKVQIGKYDDIRVTFVEYANYPDHDRISVYKGNKQDAPGLDEVWIPTGLATKYGIRVGDKMLVKTTEGSKECTVSAIVYDTMYSTAMISPSRVWVRSGQLSLWSGLDDDECVLMSVRLKSLDSLKAFKGQLDTTLPNLVPSMSIDYYTYRSISNIFNNIISMVLLAVSVILILISAGIIFFVIIGEIIRDYTYFGVYKGLGFSDRKLREVNLFRYVLLLVGVAPFGILSGNLIASGVISQYKDLTGSTGISIILVPPVMITLVVIVLVLLAAVSLSMRKLRKLEPANAIRFGYVKKEKGMKRMKMFSNTFLNLALREIRIQSFKSIMQVMIVSMLALLLFSSSLVKTAIGENFTDDITMGIPDCEIFLQANQAVTPETAEMILDKVPETNGVKAVIPLIMNSRAYAFSGEEKVSLFVYGYSSYSDESGLKVLNGRNPENDFEAAVSDSVLTRLDKRIGDMITLNIDGNEGTFLVTGSFQFISNDGKAVRLTSKACQEANPNMQYNWYSVRTKDGADVKAVKLSLQKVLGGQMTVSIMKEFVDNIMGSIVQSVNLLDLILILIMILICGASLFNIIQLHVIENRKIYGIFKGIGMSGSFINRIQYIKMLLIAAFGAAVGFILSAVLAPGMMGALFSSTGLTKVSYSVSFDGIVMTLAVICLVVLASTFFAVKKHGKTNLRELIIE
jgi:putative ABC transport system permease protein